MPHRGNARQGCKDGRRNEPWAGLRDYKVKSVNIAAATHFTALKELSQGILINTVFNVYLDHVD